MQACKFSSYVFMISLNAFNLFDQEQWQDSRRWQLTVATELPELEETPREAGRGFSNFRNGRQEGGGFNKNNRFKNGGQKRSFHRAF